MKTSLLKERTSSQDPSYLLSLFHFPGCNRNSVGPKHEKAIRGVRVDVIRIRCIRNTRKGEENSGRVPHY